MVANREHAVLSASSAHRWLNCPGSIRESQGIVSEPSIYAAEGTAAHEVAEACLTLKHKKNAADWIGKTVNTINPETKKYFVVTEAMAEAVQVYLDVVRSEHAAADSSTLTVEKKFNLDWLRDKMFGTNDAMVSQPFGKLQVFDYKNGSGVMVDAENNPQALYYALGALGEANENAFESVEIIICQPNGQGEKIKRWTVTAAYVYKWAKEVLLPGAEATDDPKAPLHAGDWCKFCPAKENCPKLRELAFETAAIAFTTADAMPIEGSKPISLTPPTNLSNEQLGKILVVGHIIEDWVDAVRKLVHQKLLGGGKVPGWKLVAGRATRKWKNEEGAEVALYQKYGEAIFDPKAFKSVKGIEDVIKGAKGDVQVELSCLVEVSRASQLAPEDDKRPALAGATEVFDKVTEAFGQ